MRSWSHQTVSTATNTSCSSCATPSTTSWLPGKLCTTGNATDSCLLLRYSDSPFLRSETVCYLVIVLNHMVSASCLTLVLPVLVFLWAMLSVPRPSKTFWMTAIIYTEVHTTVLFLLNFILNWIIHLSTGGTFSLPVSLCPQVTIVIKYFFQFGFFPFNQKLEVDRSKPFHPPNILGVEKKEGYVLYDLLQLLALFYHRAILKV